MSMDETAPDHIKYPNRYGSFGYVYRDDSDYVEYDRDDWCRDCDLPASECGRDEVGTNSTDGALTSQPFQKDESVLLLPEERRITDPDTGGAKGQKVEEYALIPVRPLAEVAKVYGQGRKKYDARNWERGYKWSLSFSAMQRHAWKFWNGESIDRDTGCHHLASVVFHALALMEFERTHPEKDDRSLDT